MRVCPTVFHYAKTAYIDNAMFLLRRRCAVFASWVLAHAWDMHAWNPSQVYALLGKLSLR